LWAGTLLAVLTVPAARAQSAAEIGALRRDIQNLRAEYGARLQALEARLAAAESRAAAPAPPASAQPAQSAQSQLPSPSPESAPPPPASPPPSPATFAASLPAPAAAATANAFNPALSLILSGLYAHTSRDPARYAISGFALPAGAGIGPGTRGLSLAESELALAANIDPWWSGSANIALHPDDTLSVEQAWVQTGALGSGLTLRLGRFFSRIGYLNAQHAHTWDFVDAPLAYQAMLGTQYGDDGMRVAWLAPSDQFFELALELGRGRGFPGDDAGRNGAGMTALAAHAGGDLGDSHSWRAGLSVLDTKADAQALQSTAADGSVVNSLFAGRTRVAVADFVWKWAPHGNAVRTNFKLQGEYLRSTREGAFTYAVDDGGMAQRWRGAQSGWYLQGVYQFMPRWRLGLRTERLDPGASGDALLGADGWRPRRNTAMLDDSPSEFSRLRVQLGDDRARPGAADRQVFLQYQMSLGAHGAHSY